jgi:hypothetical protein
VQKICKPFYEIHEHMCDRMASQPAFEVGNVQPANASEDMLGVPEGINNPQDPESEEPGGAVGPSAPRPLLNSPQPSSTMVQAHSLESGDEAEGPSSRTRRNRRIRSKRSSTQGLEASLKVTSRSSDAALKDIIAFLEKREDKERAAAQEKTDDEKRLVRATLLEKKLNLMARIKDEMGFSTEECLKYMEANGL